MRLAFWRKKEDKDKKKKKSFLREWLDAAVFAVIAATLIRTFFIEAYTIPTPSMEGSLLVNDYLFVSKVAYGPRTPMTPVAVPLVHNTIFGGESYSKSVQWGYHRLPGFGDVERNDVVVFNFPNGDTVIKEMPERDYYTECRVDGRDKILAYYDIITRPIDKKDNYIKRCVALPGDELQVKDGEVYINGKKEETWPHVQYEYVVATNGQSFSMDFLEEHGIMPPGIDGGAYIFLLENEDVDVIKNLPQVTSIKRKCEPEGMVIPHARYQVFPHDVKHFNWNRDFYGPLTIPKEGATVQLTPENIALYRRLIDVYEGNDFEEKGGKFYINGKEATSYTFKMDYFWMMGDNRHNSLDSRYWGFVPMDHIVGKASFVWFSHMDGIRWSRLFRGVSSLSK